MQIIYNILLVILWLCALSIAGYLLYGEPPTGANYMGFSATAVLLSALIASTSLMKSIDNTNRIEREKDKRRIQENKILLAYLMRTISNIAELYIEKFKSTINSNEVKVSEDIEIEINHLEYSLKNHFNEIIDKEMFHVVFYEMSSDVMKSGVVKLIKLRDDIISILANIESKKNTKIDKDFLIDISNKLADLKVQALKIKNSH